ncbi:Alpha/Beta hydrolase protein [Xylogone sp. PMI_703]|nr:Alpha/Beta hydrolase protein [Xylogone sp. PMI_703]
MADGTTELPPLPLPEGITSFYVPTSELTYHVLSAGSPTNPLILLQHGFPELAFSWRKVMLPIAAAGFHVVAYDQRGYGRTTGWDTSSYSGVNLYTFQVSRIVADAVRLVTALGHKEVECIVGHDFGSVSAAACALMRGDMFKRVVLMSHPFTLLPHHPPVQRSRSPIRPPLSEDLSVTLSRGLAELPRPVKHYRLYYAEASANDEMAYPTGASLHEFLRGYFYLKSADWEGNASIGPLKSRKPSDLATMPPYYIMPLEYGMRATVTEAMAKLDKEEVLRNMASWLSESEIAVYTAEFGRTGFQGGLNWYRVSASPELLRELDAYAGKKIKVPCCFIAGERDWGRLQSPGAVDEMVTGKSCEQFRGQKIIKGAGHWVMQENSEQVVKGILAFVEGESIK